MIMDKLLLCALCLVVVSKCVYAQPVQNCATTLCAAVMCSYGEEPFRPPGACCLKCRPAKPKEGAEFCYHDGKQYLVGTSFKIDCNTCTCLENGLAACTKMACLATCNYKGVTFLDGETIKDDCNTCQCSGGEVACTSDVCKKPAHCEGIYCLMCVGITYPGDCCPTCATLPVE